MKFLISILFLVLSLSASAQVKQGSFSSGEETLISDLKYLIEGKNLALITNKTAVNSGGKHIIEILTENNFHLKKIFTPEHGFSADDIYKGSDTEIPVIQLYGKKNSFTRQDVDGIDVIIFDIQELGARFYTYTSTLYLTMKDAADFGKTYIVCDRPSVANLNYAGGFLLDEKFSSFVGRIPAPAVFGLTIGELASFLNGEYIKSSQLFVAAMKGYGRNTKYEDVMSGWVNPSPSILSLASARNYPALCFLEGTNISEGRGTDTPFIVFGAPFVDAKSLLGELDKCGLTGVEFTETEFVPLQEKLPSYTALKFNGVKCFGLRLNVTDINNLKPFDVSVAILLSLKKTVPEFAWDKGNFIDKLAGTDTLRKMINDGYSYEEILNRAGEDVTEFTGLSSRYLLY